MDLTTYSRLAIFGIHKDDVKGYVLRSQLQKSYIEKSHKNLKEIIKPMLFCPDTIAIPDLMNRLLERREHISSIVNENGEFLGIVCLEDIIEKLVGIEIFDELDELNEKSDS